MQKNIQETAKKKTSSTKEKTETTKTETTKTAQKKIQTSSVLEKVEEKQDPSEPQIPKSD